MLRFKAPVALSAGLLAALLCSAPAHASIVQALDLDELVEQSDRIVLGTVVFAESYQRQDGTIATAYRILVERELRDDAPSEAEEPEVIVRVLGGSIGDIGMRVEGEPTFTEGERAVVFIRRGHGIAFRPVGMAQGVMRIRMEQGRETVFQSREGLMLVRRGPDGLLRQAKGALPHKQRLQVFLDRVRDVVRKKAEEASE